MEAKKVIT